MKIINYVLALFCFTQCTGPDHRVTNRIADCNAYFGVSIPQDISQIIVIPHTGCGFCIQKAEQLVHLKDWENTIFIGTDSLLSLSPDYLLVGINKVQEFRFCEGLTPAVLALDGGEWVSKNITSKNWKETYRFVHQIENRELSVSAH